MTVEEAATLSALTIQNRIDADTAAVLRGMVGLVDEDQA